MRRLMIRLTAVIAVCGFAAWQLSAPKSLPEASPRRPDREIPSRANRYSTQQVVHPATLLPKPAAMTSSCLSEACALRLRSERSLLQISRPIQSTASAAGAKPIWQTRCYMARRPQVNTTTLPFPMALMCA